MRGSEVRDVQSESRGRTEEGEGRLQKAGFVFRLKERSRAVRDRAGEECKCTSGVAGKRRMLWRSSRHTVWLTLLTLEGGKAAKEGGTIIMKSWNAKFRRLCFRPRVMGSPTFPCLIPLPQENHYEGKMYKHVPVVQ